MKKILIACVLLISWGKSFTQTILIPAEKITPINDEKITDTSGKFLKSYYQLNQRIWKIHFTKIEYDENAKLLRLFGSAGPFPGKIDFKINNFDIHLCSLNNDTIVNIIHLNKTDFINNEDNFDVQIDLKKYSVAIFSSSQRFPQIFDFSFLIL